MDKNELGSVWCKIRRAAGHIANQAKRDIAISSFYSALPPVAWASDIEQEYEVRDDIRESLWLRWTSID